MKEPMGDAEDIFLPTSPVATSPVATSPVATSPVATSPVATSPVATSPAATSHVATSHVATSPVATSPVATSPVATSPVATSPAATSHVATSHVATSPVATSPVATSPAATSPVATSPTGSLPSITEISPTVTSAVEPKNKAAIEDRPHNTSSIHPCRRPSRKIKIVQDLGECDGVNKRRSSSFHQREGGSSRCSSLKEEGCSGSSSLVDMNLGRELGEKSQQAEKGRDLERFLKVDSSMFGHLQIDQVLMVECRLVVLLKSSFLLVFIFDLVFSS